MNDKEKNKTDPNLDIPSESNTQKHINFLDVELDIQQEKNRTNRDEFSEERQKQWQEGIEQGKKERENSGE